MPSRSLRLWDAERRPRLALMEGQAAVPAADPRLADENLRGLVVLLSAHFQGFCRDLYSEAAQVIASKVRESLQAVVLRQFTIGLKLDRGNPTLAAVQEDFGRLGFEVRPALHVALADDPSWHQHLHAMNEWRNAAAHQSVQLPAMPLDLPAIRMWLAVCERVARALDGVVYTELARRLRRKPWPD